MLFLKVHIYQKRKQPYKGILLSILPLITRLPIKKKINKKYVTLHKTNLSKCCRKFQCPLWTHNVLVPTPRVPDRNWDSSKGDQISVWSDRNFVFPHEKSPSIFFSQCRLCYVCTICLLMWFFLLENGITKKKTTACRTLLLLQGWKVK